MDIMWLFYGYYMAILWIWCGYYMDIMWILYGKVWLWDQIRDLKGCASSGSCWFAKTVFFSTVFGCGGGDPGAWLSWFGTNISLRFIWIHMDLWYIYNYPDFSTNIYNWRGALPSERSACWEAPAAVDVCGNRDPVDPAPNTTLRYHQA